MKKKVFISRDLSKDSFFLSRCREMQYELVAQSLIEFKPVEFRTPPSTDWIFFYSKNAVRFFLFGLDSFRLSPNFKLGKIACIGKGTAHFAKAQKLEVQFTGNGKPKETAKQFLNLAQGQSVLFPRAKRSKKSIQKLLKEKIQAHDLIVYNNEIKKDWAIPDCDILVFTSPLNAKAYFSKHLPTVQAGVANFDSYQDSRKVIAIGNTTARALKKLGVKNVEVAEEPSEEGLWEVLKRLAN